MSQPELIHYSPEQLKQSIIQADVEQTGHFVFANGTHALIKLEMDHLWDHSYQLNIILQSLALAKGLPPADVVLGVPTGGQRLAAALVADYLESTPIALLERIPGGAKQDFRFLTEHDRRLALNARSPRIYEDVVTSLSSVAGVVRLLNPETQNIHSLAIWRRGVVAEKYQSGVTDNYLIEEAIPDFSPQLCPICNTAS